MDKTFPASEKQTPNRQRLRSTDRSTEPLVQSKNTPVFENRGKKGSI